VSTLHAKVKGQDPGDVLTVATFGDGTAADLTIPDLGALRLDCGSSPVSVTLTGGAPFDVVVVKQDGQQLIFAAQTTTYTDISDFGFFGADLWLSNVQGQCIFSTAGPLVSVIQARAAWEP
jgi:hypothetical protein